MKKSLRIIIILLCIIAQAVFVLIAMNIKTAKRNSINNTIELQIEDTTTVSKTNIDSLTPISLYKEILRLEIVHPDIVWAQAILESGWLKKHTNNNLFGMQKPKVRASFALKTSPDNYAHFETWQESVKDYKLWQQFNGLTEKQTGELLSQEEYLNYLAYTYSQDPRYTEKLISIMNGSQEILTLK